MKVKYIGESKPLELTKNKVYEVMSVEKGWYRILIDPPIAEDYLYPPKLFEVVEEYSPEKIPEKALVRSII